MAAQSSSATSPGPKVAGTNQWDKYAKGTADDLSAEQEELVNEFLRRCPPEQIESMRFSCEPAKYFACRVLRARKFVVQDALDLVGRTCKWRADTKCAEMPSKSAVSVLGCAEDELMFFYPKMYFPFPDKEGRPIYVELSGIADVDAVTTITDEEKLVQYHIYSNEAEMRKYFETCSEKAGKPITTLFGILDMSGFSMRLATSGTLNYVKGMVSIDSAHYPETLGKMLIINAPTVFSMGYALVAPFLDDRTKNKIEIISDHEASLRRLRELVDPALLPTAYGGSYKVPGGLVPSSRTRKTHMSAGTLHVEVIPVRAGQTIQVKWFVRPGDIRFSAHFTSAVEVAQKPDEWAATISKAGAAKLPAGTVTEVYKDRAHPGSDKSPVLVRYKGGGEGSQPQPTADGEDARPVVGALVCIYSNKDGWRGRDLFHRWDELDEHGLPRNGAVTKS